jgi:hypothetical protein
MPGDVRPSLFEICEEVSTLVAGLVAALMPLFLLSMPALLPLAVFTGVVLGAVGLAVLVLAVVLGAPLLLGRMLLRRL